MNNKTVYILIIIFYLIFLNFIGCIEENNNPNQNIISWEVIDCNKKTSTFIFNWSDSITGENFSKITSGISNVSLSIKNTGNQKSNLKVDLEFIVSEIIKNEDTEIQTITSNKCSCDSIENNNDSKYYSKIISLKPGEIKTISSSIDSAKLEGFKVIKWCYEINPL
ncbi:MAG: hypothetical protein V3S79_03360 [Candidatus Thermoplasmatota archaeon]|nr:hypothetical protein [Thermoplasmatales archaeon]